MHPIGACHALGTGTHLLVRRHFVMFGTVWHPTNTAQNKGKPRNIDAWSHELSPIGASRGCDVTVGGAFV